MLSLSTILIFELFGQCGILFLRCVSLIEQKLLIFPEHLSSPPVFGVARVTRSLVLCVCFVDRCLYFCTFFGEVCHCVNLFTNPAISHE
jgi:hypothetical protein